MEEEENKLLVAREEKNLLWDLPTEILLRIFGYLQDAGNLRWLYEEEERVRGLMHAHPHVFFSGGYLKEIRYPSELFADCRDVVSNEQMLMIAGKYGYVDLLRESDDLLESATEILGFNKNLDYLRKRIRKELFVQTFKHDAAETMQYLLERGRVRVDVDDVVNSAVAKGCTRILQYILTVPWVPQDPGMPEYVQPCEIPGVKRCAAWQLKILYLDGRYDVQIMSAWNVHEAFRSGDAELIYGMLALPIMGRAIRAKPRNVDVRVGLHVLKESLEYLHVDVAKFILREGFQDFGNANEEEVRAAILVGNLRRANALLAEEEIYPKGGYMVELKV